MWLRLVCLLLLCSPAVQAKYVHNGKILPDQTDRKGPTSRLVKSNAAPRQISAVNYIVPTINDEIVDALALGNVAQVEGLSGQFNINLIQDIRYEVQVSAANLALPLTPETSSSYRRSPLLIALDSGNVEAVDYILQKWERQYPVKETLHVMLETILSESTFIYALESIQSASQRFANLGFKTGDPDFIQSYQTYVDNRHIDANNKWMKIKKTAAYYLKYMGALRLEFENKK